MLLFFRLLLSFFLIIILISLIVYFSKLKIIIDVFEYNSEDTDEKLIYKGKVALYFLGKIKIFGKKIDFYKMNVIISKNYTKLKIKNFEQNNKNSVTEQYSGYLQVFKKILENTEIDKLNTQIIVDTESIILTSYLVAFISTIIPNIIKNNIKKYKNGLYNWRVMPRYKNSNYISLKLNCIISIKTVHIINMFKLIGGKRNERTSNRRLNVNCYGEH